MEEVEEADALYLSSRFSHFSAKIFNNHLLSPQFPPVSFGHFIMSLSFCAFSAAPLAFLGLS